tara:strand:+ start:66 stop:248 length:183 start_codon:yes stop_codon:yes gene_type:complete
MITDQAKKQFFMWRKLKKENEMIWATLVRMQEVSERMDAQNEAKIARLEAIISELGGDTT